MLLKFEDVTAAFKKGKPRRVLYKALGKNESSSMLWWLWYKWKCNNRKLELSVLIAGGQKPSPTSKSF